MEAGGLMIRLQGLSTNPYPELDTQNFAKLIPDTCKIPYKSVLPYISKTS